MPFVPRPHLDPAPFLRALARSAPLAVLLSLAPAARAALQPTAASTLLGSVSGRHLGRTVATAGDLDGDGYSDVLVTGNGTVSVYRGGPGGNLFDPSRLAWSKVNFPYGVQAAGIGDVDGDGHDDIAVAWGFRVRVYYGGPGGVDTTRTFDFSPSVSVNDVVQFPVAIAPAGDVNGDGVPDLLVGSAESVCGPGNTGVVWVFYGHATTGLSSSSFTQICASSVSISNFGASVATAGDVNKDGYTDVVVGAPGAPNGAAFVYLGGSGGLATTAATRINGTQSNGQFGASVSTAGDVNGDGWADILVGAPGESFSTLTGDGTAYLFLGGGSGVSTSPAWFENGPAAGDHMGASVATAGDINGDGLADFLVGVPGRSDPETGEGQFAVFMGNPSAGSITTSLYPESNSSGAALGSCVATAGDVNGDGMGDVIVSAPNMATPQTNAGAAYLYLGAADLPDKNAPFSTTFGLASSVLLGSSVAVGDFSGDGIADLAVGEPGLGAGGVQLMRGASGGLGSATGSFSTGPASAGIGTALAMNGDLDADGFADLAVGAVSRSSVDSGAVYVFRGNTAGTLSSPYAVLRAPGAQAGDGFGASVAWADVNGDGRSDLIVGSPDWHGPLGLQQGRVLVYLSQVSGLHTGQSPSQEFDGPGSTSEFGASVACAGDFNRDGVQDVIVGAPGYDIPAGPILTHPDGGYVALFLGGLGGLAANPVASATGTGAYSRFPGWQTGSWVAGVGDLDGDGYSDVAFSSIGVEQVTVWYGGANGAAGSATITTPAGGTQFGACVAGAGDVDDDGDSDLLIGAPLYTGDFASLEGRVFLYRGSASRTFGAADWYKDGGQANAALGSALGAGDLNGDGFADVAVGAPQYDGGLSHQGYVQTFLGDRGSRYAYAYMIDPTFTRPIQPQTTCGGASFLAFSGKGKIALGRLHTRLEVSADQVAYGTDHQFATGGFSDNGGLFSFQGIAINMNAGRPYAWQARWRSQSPLFPWTPWLSGSVLGAKVYAALSGPIPLAVDGSPVPAGLEFSPPRPSPFTGGELTLAFAQSTPGRVSLRLFDVQGRARRTLADAWRPAGRYALAWDGRDDAGRAVAPGVYFARLEAGSLRATRRIVRVE